MISEPSEDQKLEQEIERALKRRRLDFYKPYPKQLEFHRAGGTPGVVERLLMAGNQVGKCSTFASYLDLPDGTRKTFGELYQDGRPFDVFSWDGEKVIITRAIVPIRKPSEQCVRLWFSDGRWFECALGHRILTSSEWQNVEHLLAFVPNLRVSNSEYVQSIRDEDALSLTRIRQDFLVGCLQGLRLCDGQLHRWLNTVRAWLQRRADAPRYNWLLYAQGACSSRYTNNVLPFFDHPSNPDATGRHEDRFVGYLTQAAHTFSECTKRYIQAWQRLVLELLVPLQSNVLKFPDQSLLEASESPLNHKVGNSIIAYEPIGCHDVYDFTVPETQNYVASGLIHHNTLSAAAEVAIHATGHYPEWWGSGYRFNHPIKAWVSGETSQSTRDNPQRLLLGETGEWGTGMIPGRQIEDIKRAVHGVSDSVETVFVRHEPSGQISRLQFKTYDQERKRWQGETLDFVWFDEEPPMDIYSEGKTRVQATNGFVFMTFTPLLGMSDVVRRFLLEKPQGSVIISMTIEDALHYTIEQRARIVANYPEHERSARSSGIPVLGSGRVFPVDEKQLMEIPIQIPAHWPRICGMDIGWEHPTAAVWIAWDRDTDIVHIYDAYRVKEQTPVVHAAAIKARGTWIPVAWPHDGLAHDKGSGAVIAKQYRDLGVKMLAKKSTHPPLPGKEEGSGGYGVEAGIMNMLERMQTGRLKVASHLADWFEEFRLFHRKDGIIVKMSDDLMSATRMAIMMLRFASVMVRPQSKVIIPAYHQTDPTMGVLG